MMKRGENLALIPGGFEEASITSSDKITIFIRKGFIKFALKYGYNLYPTITFGEEKAFKYLEGN